MNSSLQMLDGSMEARINNMETGLQQLDETVSLIDRKVDQLGNVQMEMFDEQNRMGENLSAELRHQKEQLNKWQQDMKKEIYSKGMLHSWGLGCILIIWFLTMLAWILSNYSSKSGGSSETNGPVDLALCSILADVI